MTDAERIAALEERVADQDASLAIVRDEITAMHGAISSLHDIVGSLQNDKDRLNRLARDVRELQKRGAIRI